MGGLFSKPKVPDIEPTAPAVDNPIEEPKDPVLGTPETAESKRKKGKKGLKIDLNTSGSSGSGVGVNTP